MSRLVPAPDALVGKRFDVAVAKMLGISRAKAADLIETGQARVLGRDIAKSSSLQAGETVEFDIVEERSEPEPIAHDMAVVYEDDDVVVVDKPVGVAAHASVGWTGPTVLGSLLDRGVRITSYGAAGRQGIVSRLDVGTSGLMLVCKSELAYVEMRRQFAEHEVVKTYHALVQGNLKEDKATIEAPIGRAKVSDFRFCVTPAGKEAITHWDVMERFGEATLVSVNLETGRTHQIRVHFSSIGHPLVGDPMYGANPQLSEALGLERQWLHAMQLEFRHPRTHVWTTVRTGRDHHAYRNQDQRVQRIIAASLQIQHSRNDRHGQQHGHDQTDQGNETQCTAGFRGHGTPLFTRCGYRLVATLTGAKAYVQRNQGLWTHQTGYPQAPGVSQATGRVRRPR